MTWIRRTNQRWMSMVLIFLTSFSLSSAEAQRKSKREKKTTIDFEDQLIEGELKKPELFYLLQKRNFNYGRLIQLRKDFIPEMIKSSEDIAVSVDSGMELPE